MDYERLFNEAVELFNSSKYEEAAEKFEEVANATNNVAAIANAIRAYYILAVADCNMAKNGMYNEEYSLDSVTKAIELLQFVIGNEIITEDKFRDMLRDCYAIKGYILMRCQNGDCETYFNSAINMGDNQSRFWMIYHYCNVLDNDNNEQMIDKYFKKIVALGESYIQYYSPEDTEDDDLRTVSLLLSGLLEEKNPEKAKKYAQIANSYDEITRTSNPSQQTSEKKRRWFGR